MYNYYLILGLGPDRNLGKILDTMGKYMLTRFICWIPLLVLSPLVLAQTPQMPLPACTAEIVDTDGRDETADQVIDVDNDGLIEIYDLESLNEMRYQLDGSGHKTSAGASKNTRGCPESGCIGYELVKDLDFNADASYRTTSNKVTWTMGEGWSPIGSDSNHFSGVFEGNGHTIANLYINRSSDNVGLFAVTTGTAQMNNIKLSDVNVQGGDDKIGSLVGINYGSIISIDVTGTVNGNIHVGGLVGENAGQISKCVANVMVTGGTGIGGLVGVNVANGVIRESRASGNVIGTQSAVGGLVGWNNGGVITNTYAEGTVSTDDVWAGGLVGFNGANSITNSYAIGKSSGKAASTGGLVGAGGGRVTQSYWDTEANMQASRGDFEAAFAKTTTEMQSPTGPGTTTTTEIYYGWSTDIWDFGSTNTYPVLRSAGSFAVDGSMSYDVGIEVAIDVDKDGDGLIEICDLEGINEMRYQLDGSGYKASAAAARLTQGCPDSGCIGYELVKDLDFDVDDSYRTISNKESWIGSNADGWSPIGSDTDRFSGVFEGNGFMIANLYINRRSSNDIGLFAGAADTAQINNVRLLNVNIQGDEDVGSLVGDNLGSIININVTGMVNGNSDVGGLVGQNQSQIISSVANVIVTGIGASNAYIGGLVGVNGGEGIIRESSASGNVMGRANVGGLSGINFNRIINSYTTGDVVASGSSAGGLSGVNFGGHIENTYAEGAVSGRFQTGGLVGWNLSDTRDGKTIVASIINSYAISAINFTSLDIGGLVGWSEHSFIITASYWDKDKTGQATSDGGEDRTTVQLQSPLAPGFAETDTYYGWSNEVWYFGSTNTYPLLRFTVDADGDGILDGDADNRIDIDQDGDGLIEIYDLEGLNEMRYQLDGSGYRASADATKITRGCPATGCRGYELMKDLDFNTDDSYRSAASNKTAWTDPNAAGWQPIGNSSDGFSSVLEGNGHTIAHLYINRSNEGIVGLLAFVASAQVQNIRLLNVNIKGDFSIGSLAGSNSGIIINVRVTGTVSGRINVGGLTGNNTNQIISSFANVTVTASQNSAGGLVGGNSISNVGPPAFISESGASGNVMGDQFVGGLSGRNFGNIINSYATGSATGRDSVGGLVGLCNTDCIIANTYATGTVIGASEVGGLVGDHDGSMMNSYATGNVSATGGNVGGLVGTTMDGVITASYWNTETSGQSASVRGSSRTTVELQLPTAPGATVMDTYHGWSADIWDFGDATEYPTLHVPVAGRDIDGDLVLDEIDIDDDNDGLIEIHTIDDLHEIRFQLNGSGKKQNAEDANNTTGCPRLGCIGYELARSLDFNDVNSYRNYRIKTDWTVANYADNSDHGWDPLPAFSAVFNGNGHIIRNLQINRVSHNNAGLFGVLHRTGRIEHVELVYPNVRGQSNVGGLVGNNNGVISNSYVRDYDTNPNNRDRTKLIEAIEGSVGGLVGRNNGGGVSIGYVINSGAVIDVQIKQNTSDDGVSANAGGLVGFNLNGAEIRNSYARGAVKGPCGVGGLTANNFSTDKLDPDTNSKIINSYASGTLTTGFGNCDVDGNVRSGGLAAINGGLISNSYTTSCWGSGGASGVSESSRGGLFQSNSSTVLASYHQTTGCSGLQSNDTTGKEQAALRLRNANGIYKEWSVNEWDFGTDSEYPLIRYTVGADKDNPECGTLSLSACNALIKHQGRTATDEGSPAANPSFVSGNIVSRITSVGGVGAFILQPPQFNLTNSKYKLYVQDTRAINNLGTGMGIDLIFGSNYRFSNCKVTNAISSSNITCDNTTARILFYRFHTFKFDIEYTSTNPNTKYSSFSLEVIPIVASPFDARVTVNSEVNEEPATFIDDGAVIRVEEGDTVRMNVADGFIVQDGINLPLSYQWYSSSGPTLISGELRGQSISFDIDDTMFRDSRNGDAIVTLEMRDQSGTVVTPVIQEIPIRIFGRLSLTSDAVEVMRDPADKTLHRVVLASDQPQAIITARALNETLTVDDSAEQVSVENGDGTSLASEITVQLDTGSKTEFAIIATDSDNNATTHTVRVFRRSGAVSLQDIELTDITFDETISAPGSYAGILPIGTASTTITQITVTAGETNAISIITVTVDEDGDGTPNDIIFNAGNNVAEPRTELTITLGTSVNLTAGSVMSITIRTRDAYIDETRAVATLADLPYNEGIYTITIENEQPIDDDNDGLIDIYMLDDLDEMRNQYTNMPSTCGINSDLACEGFELRRSLDFNAADSYQDNTINTAWTTGDGWPRLGSSGFNRVFDGNGFTISGLYIRTGNSIGLFAVLGSDGVIKNVGLLDVSIRGDIDVGSLVGENKGTIINSYATTATVMGNASVGGLVGRNRGSIINSYATTATIVGDLRIGGLVGANQLGSIISSFAYADVIGFENIGGLVGWNKGDIINTYAAGTVASTQTVVSAGGLVGQSTSDSEIRNSYAVSRVMPLTDGDSQVDGLVGDNDGTITASYWDKTVNAHLTTSDGATSRTTAELQNPTAPGATSADTYYGWHTAAWDFGDRSHYPTLYYATTDSITVSACADSTMPSSALPRCGSRLPNQAVRNLNPIPVLEVSEITMSSQPVANADGTINEGSNVRLMVNATGGSESYRYAWSQISGNTLELGSRDGATLDITIPPNLVELDATMTTVTFQVEVSDGSLTISRRAIITIQKIDNGSPDIEVDVNPSRLRVITTTADADGTDSFSYQWQQLVFGGAWTNIPAATTAAYWLPADVDARIQYRVEVTHTDSQGHTINYQQGPFRVRFDDDGDGLIDIYTLEDLDAIRNQYSNMPSTCGSNADIACNGFELRRSLDFNAADSYQNSTINTVWTTGRGWLPIGRGNPTHFGSVFEGNGYTLSGLYINSSNNGMALFSILNATGQIKNIGLLDVDMRGSWRTAGLVATNNGSIINSYATGKVSGSNGYIGGLVGENGYGGSIRSSFAKVRVSGRFDVGGLVGLHSGRITNSYAAGTVSATSTGDASVGGLVGKVGPHDGEIINSYAVGRVISSGGSNVGGLVGDTTGTVIVSYWDAQTSGLQSSAGAATSRTTMELQSPTAPGVTPTDTYYGWDDKVWDFGNSEEYPALRYVGGGLNACNADMSTASDLPQCGSLLANQERTKDVALVVSEVTLSSQPAANSDATINEGSNVRLMVNVTGGSGIYKFSWSQTSGNTLELGSSDGATLDITIPPDFIAKDAATTMLTFTVMVDDGVSTISRSKMITINKASLTISGVMLSAATIAEGSTTTVTFDVSGGTGIYQYAYKLIAGADEIALPSLAPPAVLEIPTDIVAAAASDRVVELNIIVRDDGGRRVEHNEELTIQKIDNGLAEIEASRATSRTVTVKVGSDPDGDATTPNYAYQWQWRAAGGAQWMDIEGATDASYTISDEAKTSAEYRVQVMYIDGQGYEEIPTSKGIRYTLPGSAGLRIRIKVFLEGPLR